MACAPKGHSLQGLRIRFCSNVFWRVKQQIWYSREVFSKPRLYSHLNTSKKSRDFEDLLRAWALSSPVTFLTGDHVYKSDLTRSHLHLLTIGSLSKDVFERRTSAGSEVFSLFICLDTTKFVLLSFFSPIKTIYLRVSTKRQPNAAKSPLPVDVRRS